MVGTLVFAGADLSTEVLNFTDEFNGLGVPTTDGVCAVGTLVAIYAGRTLASLNFLSSDIIKIFR